MKYYVPGCNDEVLYLQEEILVPEDKLIQLVKKIYFLNKQYKVEKIISYNNKDYTEELKEILNNKTLELHNHYIYENKGYFHITFEKELIKDDKNIIYDQYCPYAISLIIDGNIDRDKYQELFIKNTMRWIKLFISFYLLKY